MATTFYLNSATIIGRLASYNSRGSATATLSGTTNGSTWIFLGSWVTKPLEAFTLSGNVIMNVWGFESANQANASLGMRIYRYIPSTNSISGLIGQASSAVELATNPAGSVRTGTLISPPSTVFNSGDMIWIEMGIVNVGTMGTGQTVTLQYSGPTAGVSGDSYFTITENVKLKNRNTISS